MAAIEQLKNVSPEISGRQLYEYKPKENQPKENQLLSMPIGAIGLLLATLVVWVRNMMGAEKNEFRPVSESMADTRMVDHDLEGMDSDDSHDEPGQVTDRIGADSSPLGDDYVQEFAEYDPTNTDVTPDNFTRSGGFGRNERSNGFTIGSAENGFQFPSDNKGTGGRGAFTGDDNPENDEDRPDAPQNTDDDSDDSPSGDPNDCRCGHNGKTNRAPIITAAVVLGELLINQSRALALADFLQNASDPDNDDLTIEHLKASSGTLIANDDGTWTFTPDADDTTGVTFTYDVTDGEYTVQQTAVLDLIPHPGTVITGTDASDTILGTPGDDVIDARGGDDTVLARAGSDIVRGGTGDDLIFGGEGDDQLFGDDGADKIFGGGGNDLIFGGAGDDVIFAGEGNDVVKGEDGSDQIFGGTGNDILDGGASADTIGAGDGNDLVIGGAGNDIIEGRSGDDQFIATIGDGDDVYSGGTGVDTYDLSETTTNAKVDLEQETASSAQTGQDQIIDIENVIGSEADDVIKGDDQNNVLSGGQGDDHIVGLDGSDIIVGGDGNDTVIAGQGEDTVLAGEGDDTIIASVSDGDDVYFGGSGTDTYDLSETTSDAIIDLSKHRSESVQTGLDLIFEFENAKGGHGNDFIVANNSVNVLTGGAGNDTFVFHTIRDAILSNLTRDQITDFEVGDKIDLSEIDANWGQAGEQTFDWLDNVPDFFDAGILKFRFEIVEGEEYTIVEGNVDLDEDVELEIELLGKHHLNASDFIGVG